MSSKGRVSRQPSILAMRWRRRLTQSFLQWSLSRYSKTLEREQARLLLLQLTVDGQLLRLKELELRKSQTSLRLLELEESYRFRVQRELPLPPEKDPMDELLGL